MSATPKPADVTPTPAPAPVTPAHPVLAAMWAAAMTFLASPTGQQIEAALVTDLLKVLIGTSTTT